MEQELMKLYNTMMLIETKGESTKLMGKCLDFVLLLASKAKQTSESTDETGG